MTVLAIEIADVGLNAASTDGPLGLASPGFVALDGGKMLSGDAARAISRLRPRHTSSRFWDRLDQRSVGRPFPRGLTHADLVHAHLNEYWTGLRATFDLSLSGTSVLLAVPGAWSTTQLGLLLGIARACNMPVTGLVDSALAALHTVEGGRPVLHLDIRLHRAVLTWFETDGRRARKAVASAEAAGLLAFYNAWAQEIASRFVRETRFDPLHRARDEQALYDALPDLLERLAVDGASEVSVETRSGPRSIEIDRTRATTVVASHVDAIREAAGRLPEPTAATAALSANAARIPGLAGHLEELTGQDAVILPDGSAAAGAFAQRALIEDPGQELPLVLGLPVPERHG
jgi:hypothetical protein